MTMMSIFRQVSSAFRSPLKGCGKETLLLLFFLLLQILLIAKHWNVATGFDWPPHAAMIPAVQWTGIDFNIYSMFYGYHPPLTFLLAKIFFSLGIPVVASIQLVSWLSMVTSFLCFRSSLRCLGIFSQLESIALLYITYALPINVYLSYSVNMDSVIFAIASILVLLSVSAFARPRQSWARDITIVILMAIVLAAGLLTKFTGLLLFSIPFLALIFFASQRFWQKLWMPAFACAIAFLLVFPYYYARYYREHGTWLPSNTNHFDAGPQLSARKARDEDRLAFFLSLFSPSPVHEQGIELRDLEHPRLSDTWKDFWMKDQWLTDGQQGEDSGFAPAMSRLYIFLMPFLILGGLLLSFTKSSSGPWKQLGRFLFFFSLLLLLALIAYIYKNPWAGSLANKAIYIAPFSWSLGFAVAQYFQFLKRFSTLRFLLCGIFCVFIALNFFIPVY